MRQGTKAKTGRNFGFKLVFNRGKSILDDMTKSVTIVLCCLLSGALYCPAEDGDNEEGVDTTPRSNNPYQAIADLNAFRLRPTPPPPEPEKVKTPPPKITLTGIATRGGQKKVYLKSPGTPAKPGEPAKEQYYEIAEGVTDRDIEVLEINPKAGTVRIKYEGTEIPLNFVDNGAKAIAPPPGQPGLPGTIPPPGTAAIPTTSFGTPGSNVKIMPSRTLRLPTPSANAAPSMAPGYGHSNPAPQTSVQQNELSAEQHIMMVELERERTKGQVAAGLLPPLPPTPLSPPGSPGTEAPGPPGVPPLPQ
jgi:hypothetical protein